MKTFIILGAVILGLILLIIFRPTGQVNYSVPRLTKLDSSKITKVIIEKNNEKIELEKDSQNKWLIMPQGYPANQDTVKSLVNNAAGLEIMEFISDKGSYTPYELDDNKKILVTIYSGDDLARQFAVGKSSSTTSHSYVLLANDLKVWTAKGNLRVSYDQSSDEMRDKTIFNFQSDSINEVLLEKGGKSVTLTKNIRKEKPEGSEEETEITEWISNKSNKAVDENTVRTQIIQSMSNLNCENYLEDKKVTDYNPADASYTITLKGTKDYTLRFFDEKDSRYTAIASDNDYVFEIASWKATNIMQDFSDWE